MLKNLKIDIIYYNTPSDFEFEFNLGGYCRSRILNAKANGLKETLTKLAVAVSRSRVIIIIGELLGENGCIAPVAKAISKQLVQVDHRQYHITSPEPINIIEGSLPLVSSNGEFGGCIIESGPQSIVFLSQDKSLRSSIEKELLSHYLTSLSMTSDEENDIVNFEETATEPEKTNDIELSNESVLPEEPLETIVSENTETIDTSEIAETTEDTEDSTAHEEDILSDAEPEDIEFEIDAVIEEDIISKETEEVIFEDNATEETAEKPQFFEETDSTVPISEDTEPIKTEMSDLFSGSNEVISNDSFDNEGDDFDNYENVEKEPKKPLSPLIKVLLVLFAVLFVVVAILLYYTVYLPGLDGVSFSEFIGNVLSLIKCL